MTVEKLIPNKERKPNQASTQVEASKWKSNQATPSLVLQIQISSSKVYPSHGSRAEEN
jgi:hypothetical protein